MGSNWSALVAGCKPLEGVDVVDELLNRVVDAAAGGGPQEEEEQEGVEEEERLPPPQVQWPAYQTVCVKAAEVEVCLSHCCWGPSAMPLDVGVRAQGCSRCTACCL